MQPFMILWLNFPLNKRISAFQVLSPRPKGLPFGSPCFLFKSALSPLFKPYFRVCYNFQINSKYVKINRKCNPNATHKSQDLRLSRRLE
nr:MAG TPA: hypothetical protein [Caudoviricetes sp.]